MSQDGGHCCPAIPSACHGGLLSVARLHVCGVCVSVPGQGRCQRWACHSPRREIGGLGTKAHRTLASSPGPPTPNLGSECGARNWSPAQPQYCHLRTRPCKSPEDCPPQKLPSREHLCQLWSGEVGPGPGTSVASLPCHPEQMSSSGCGPYLTPSSLPVLQPAHLPPASRTLLACMPLGSCPVRLLLFCSAFALHWCGGPSPQLPSCYLLTLRRKVSKSQEQDRSSLPPSPNF